jgi:hypothetical protein
MVELELQTRLLGGVEERERAVELGVLRPPAEGFEAVRPQRIHVVDRLEHRGDLLFENDALQLLLVSQMSTVVVELRVLVGFLNRPHHQALRPHQGVMENERSAHVYVGALPQEGERRLRDARHEISLDALSDLLDILG